MAIRPARTRRARKKNPGNKGPGNTRRGRRQIRLLACRTLVALAAGCFVAAFTIAALAPPGLSLGDGLQRLSGRSVSGWLAAGRAGVGWQGPVLPVLLLPFLTRPAWLLPVMLGFISAGIAISLGRALPNGAAR